MRRGWLSLSMCVALLPAPAFAQRSAENVVNTAEDAFGASIGTETIGLYSPTSARGFNPTLAGNIRIDGLYFDQQNNTSGRLYSGTTMRVGLSAQSYPFPAPTGIADTRLQRPGDRFSGSVAASFGPYGAKQGDLELGGPIVPDKLGGFATFTAFTSKTDWQSIFRQVVYGGLFRWTPSDNVDVVVFNQGQSGGSAVQPLIFTAGGILPPQYDRSVYTGQPWAKRHREVNHGGVLISAAVFDNWLLRAGVFRSINALTADYFAYYRNVQPDGFGTLDILRNAPFHDISYSGEIRLSRTFSDGPRQHTVHISVRGRDVEHLFGGGSIVSVGPAQIGVYAPVPEPIYPPLTPPNISHVSQQTPGLSYVGRWLGAGEISIGIQKSFFSGEVTPVGQPTNHTTSRPWLYNGTLAVFLNDSAALYGSYTRGLEESGVAPENAANRAEVLPVSLTEQIDAGVRYKFGSGFTLIVGVFEVKKPYFDRNAANIFTNIGSLSHRGVELSFSGQVAPGLTVVAGAMLLKARIQANSAVASFIAPVPVGRPNRNVRLNVQYGPPSWRGFSIDGQISQDGPAYTNRANSIRLSANTTADVGARYVFKMLGTSASVRAKVSNVTDAYGWTVSSSGVYAPIPARRFTAQLVADF